MLSPFVKENAWMKFQSDSKMNKLCEWQNMRITLVQEATGWRAKKLSIKSQHEYECHRHWQKMWRRVCRMFYKLENIPPARSKIVRSINHAMLPSDVVFSVCRLLFSFSLLFRSRAEALNPSQLVLKLPSKRTLTNGCTLNDYNFIMVFM